MLVVSSCVRGHNIYQDRWVPITKEELFCQHEPCNIKDPHAVTILKDDIVVGHVPRKISTMCLKGGLMKSTITGSKRRGLSRIAINCTKLYQVVYYNAMHCVERVVPREAGLWVLYLVGACLSWYNLGQLMAILDMSRNDILQI